MIELARTALLLAELRRGARRPASLLRERQGRLLRDAVAHAYREVPFYRRVWDAAGFDPASVRSIDDLRRLPIVDSEVFRDAVESGEAFARSADVAALPCLSSSGTSGRALRVPRGPVEARLWRAAGLFTLLEHGFRGRRTTVQFDPPPGRVHPLQRLGIAATVWIPTALPLEDQLARLTAARPDIVIGTPTVLRRIGRALAGRRLPSPRLVVCQGEVLDAGSRALIRDTLGADPVSVYGLTEAGYVAWQCEARGAMHVNAELFAVEVLGDGADVAPGGQGRVVVTDLRGRTMPMLRCDTGDLARAADEPCPCGRTLPTIGPVEGRRTRTIVGRDHRRVTTRAILDRLAGILTPDDFRLAQAADGSVRLDVTPEAARRADLSRALDRLRELLGAVAIEVAVVELPNAADKTEVVTRR